MKKELKYPLILTAVYFLTAALGMLRHEIWFDEAQAWLIGRDSDSLPGLFANLRYEGHPFLWHFCLFIISRFTTDPFWMQVFHLFVATASVFVFLRNAPFSWFFKVLFIFGYYMVFEYCLISRSYILGVFFLFLACSFYKDRQRKFLPLCLALAFALNTHLFFAVVALCFFLLLACESVFNEKAKHFTWGAGLFAVAFAFLVYQLIPPQDTLFFSAKGKIPLLERIVHSGSFLIKGIVNIPDFRSLHFWNTHLIVNFSKPIALIISILLLGLPLLLFYKNRKVLVFTYVCFLALFLLFFIARVSGARFSGVAFIVLIIGLWIDYSQSAAQKSTHPVIYVLLLIHCFSGIYAYALDFGHPFFNSAQLKDYFKDNGLDRKEVVAISHEGVTLSAVLQRRIFFLSRNSYQSFYIVKYDYKLHRSQAEVIAMLDGFSKRKPDFIFASYIQLDGFEKMLPRKTASGLEIKYLTVCRDGIVDGLKVYIYEVSKN